MSLLTNAATVNFSSGMSRANYSMSDDAFGRLRKFIYDNCGIYFQDNKKYLLESRLVKRINFLQLSGFEDYIEFLKFSSNFQQEKRFLYEAITINETFFFRNQPQLDALVTKILPEIIEEKKKAGKNKIRIWSAASSSGEEAYSVAISIVDMLRLKYPNFEYEIVGTDISQQVLDTAKSGIYKEYSIRNTPAHYLKKYFKMKGAAYELDPNIKKMVQFKHLNLYDDAAMRAMSAFDVIFCANVLIYFDLNSKIKVVSHLYNSLNKGGYLFIGYSETLHTVSKAFKLVSFTKTIGYKKE
jgi:chemotaxis protein methyltransferase CheR